MQRTFIYLALACIMFAGSAVFAQSTQGNRNGKAAIAPKGNPEVTVYYFHVERRCHTCLAVEKTAKEYVEAKYKDDKRVTFKSINVEKEENQALAEKYQAAGSMLLVTCGDKTEDITAEGFRYGRSTPEKLESLLKDKIAAFLK